MNHIFQLDRVISANEVYSLSDGPLPLSPLVWCVGLQVPNHHLLTVLVHPVYEVLVCIDALGADAQSHRFGDFLWWDVRSCILSIQKVHKLELVRWISSDLLRVI